MATAEFSKFAGILSAVEMAFHKLKIVIIFEDRGERDNREFSRYHCFSLFISKTV